MPLRTIQIRYLGPQQFEYTENGGSAAEVHTNPRDQEPFRWCTEQSGVSLEWPNGHPFVSRTPPGAVPSDGCCPGSGTRPHQVRQRPHPPEYKYDVVVRRQDGTILDRDDPKIIIDDVRDKWKLILLLAGAGLGAWLMWRHFRRKG